MIKTVKISNFKSVQELELELGRLNVFIGENGCGKTSILEGIAMGGAAAIDKPDSEFLVNRGIRVTEPKLMHSAFNEHTGRVAIGISIKTDDFGGSFSIPLNKWGSSEFQDEYSVEIHGQEGINWMYPNSVLETLPITGRLKSEELLQTLKGVLPLFEVAVKYDDDRRLQNEKTLAETKQKIEQLEYRLSKDKKIARWKVETGGFLLFAPENHFLRRFEEEGQIRPLGIRGEGLFRHLVELSKEEPETFKAISEQLSLIDWFGGLSIPNNLQFTERRIAITDRFIADTIKEFDQRSANEGFLYLLFYFTLFLSKYTPKFFAIDNIDNSLNPKLCAKLVEVLAKLAKENDKQAILTTHNPAILDGLDLTDDDQRLFVIYRNADGETKARRVKPLKEVAGVEPVRLSEAFVRGYLGGLPKNF